ncbi:hypothetical protein [Bacillus phage vB_BsuS_PJN02]|uniref:Uncharacterized protein n=1 Tax=Bacillus phage vB_BsuS_PJN02 TaxID=2920374 RepID=A0AC61TS22_9CAUD|nr:hypothetical protein PQE76_gp126 [Bacillus phage vB_BsuS_PJN02]UNH58469.1 hypothetical protein [Bacillus phage vB_BsuS_PJN02]
MKLNKTTLNTKSLRLNSDLFLINNNDGSYYVEKSRFSQSRVTINENEFKYLLSLSKYPIVLNKVCLSQL